MDVASAVASQNCILSTYAENMAGSSGDDCCKRLSSGSAWPQHSAVMSVFVAGSCQFESAIEDRAGASDSLLHSVPIYAAEREYELQHGMKPFLHRLVEHEVPMTVDINRPSFA